MNSWEPSSSPGICDSQTILEWVDSHIQYVTIWYAAAKDGTAAHHLPRWQGKLPATCHLPRTCGPQGPWGRWFLTSNPRRKLSETFPIAVKTSHCNISSYPQPGTKHMTVRYCLHTCERPSSSSCMSVFRNISLDWIMFCSFYGSVWLQRQSLDPQQCWNVTMQWDRLVH